MYPAGILVVTLFAAAFANVGDQPQDQNPPGGTTSTALVPLSGDNDSPPIHMSEFCFFGKYPSATCRFRCHLMNMEAYCNDTVQSSGEGKCVCKPETTPEVPPEEESQELFEKPETHKEQEAPKPTTKPTSTFTIPMHTAVQEEESKPEEDQTQHHVVFYIFDLNKIFGPKTNETTSEGTQTEIPQAAPAGWALQHFIAFLIILLLVVLIFIELYACYKKQRAKNNDMESIFKNIPMPNKA